MRISPPSGRRSKITSASPRGRREGQRGKRGGVSEQLGLELRRIREEQGLTVEELAEKSGISATTIRAAERRTRDACSWSRSLSLSFSWSRRSGREEGRRAATC
jgi:DNA-binding XRE family transcriptional regulator